MAGNKNCEICRRLILPGDSCHFVKVKGDRRIRWYCQKCVKGGGKDDTAGKRH